MTRTGRPKEEISLTDNERTELERLIRRVRTNPHLAKRAKLVLMSANGASDIEVAKKQRVNHKTVAVWRKRFAEHRFDGLYDEPRPGAQRKINDDKVEEVVVQTLETTPKGCTHWSTRKMARKAGISKSSVGRIWRANGLRPHIVRGFKLSNDPQFIEKVRDIVGLYMNPPDNALDVLDRSPDSFDQYPEC